MTYRHLNETTIRAIADKYDLDPEDHLVRDNAAHADGFHGQPGRIGHWTTNSAGLLDAALLLDGYLHEETRAARCEALAADQFHRDAY